MKSILTYSFLLAAVFIILRLAVDAVRAYGRTLALHGYWTAMRDIGKGDVATSCDEIVKRVKNHRDGGGND